MGTNFYWLIQPLEGRHIGKHSIVSGIRAGRAAPLFTWADDPVRVMHALTGLWADHGGVPAVQDEYGRRLNAHEMAEIIIGCAAHDYSHVGEDFS